MSFIDALPPEEVEAPIDGNEVEFKWDNYHEEAIKEVDDILDDEDWDEHPNTFYAKDEQNIKKLESGSSDDEDNEDDDYEVEVEYKP
jgi:hypothetical protein